MNKKRILVTGGTGSWGNEFVRQCLKAYDVSEIVIFSRGEHKQVEMQSAFKGLTDKLRFVVGDVRDKSRLKQWCSDVDIIFHMAALKHVPVCEDNTWEAVQTNIIGTQNVIECAIEANVETVVDISTDKAVDPFNHYGVTKSCAEKMIINASFNYSTRTKFVCIRGGNVLGTNGSVIPLFKRQILDTNEITLTNPEMTRYLMTKSEAIGLVLEAVKRAKGGEIFVMRMDATSVNNIADAMIAMFGDLDTKKVIIGSRPGEKMHEVLVSRYEAPFTKIISDKYYVVLPQHNDISLNETYKKYPNIDIDEFNSLNASQLSPSGLLEKIKGEKWLTD
ncbi:polysaccharide biosynthesis protein [Schleiferiaceae bacterium]|nr:polysaccharide biosynthesis protein [Schleiferiaceae bacterium]